MNPGQKEKDRVKELFEMYEEDMRTRKLEAHLARWVTFSHSDDSPEAENLLLATKDEEVREYLRWTLRDRTEFRKVVHDFLSDDPVMSHLRHLYVTGRLQRDQFDEYCVGIMLFMLRRAEKKAQTSEWLGVFTQETNPNEFALGLLKALGGEMGKWENSLKEGASPDDVVGKIAVAREVLDELLGRLEG